MSRYIGVQGRRGSLALAPWKSKLLLGSKVIVPPVISIVTQHKRFLLERKMGNSWKVSPLAIQLLHTHTHTHIYKKKMAIILPTGQWYAPSAVINDAW